MGQTLKPGCPNVIRHSRNVYSIVDLFDKTLDMIQLFELRLPNWALTMHLCMFTFTNKDLENIPINTCSGRTGLRLVIVDKLFDGFGSNDQHVFLGFHFFRSANANPQECPECLECSCQQLVSMP